MLKFRLPKERIIGPIESVYKYSFIAYVSIAPVGFDSTEIL